MKKSLPWIALAALWVWYFLIRKPAVPATSPIASGSMGGGNGGAGGSSPGSALSLFLGGGSGASNPLTGLFSGLGNSVAQLFNQGVLNPFYNNVLDPIFNPTNTNPGPGNVIPQDFPGEVQTIDLGTPIDTSGSGYSFPVDPSVTDAFGGSGPAFGSGVGDLLSGSAASGIDLGGAFSDY